MIKEKNIINNDLWKEPKNISTLESFSLNLMVDERGNFYDLTSAIKNGQKKEKNEKIRIRFEIAMVENSHLCETSCEGKI